MAKPRVHKGDVVRLLFWDHVEGADEPLEFYLYGRVFHVSRTHYVVDVWCYPDIDHPDRSENINRFTILRRTVTDIKIYESEYEHGRKRRPSTPDEPGGTEKLGQVLGRSGTEKTGCEGGK